MFQFQKVRLKGALAAVEAFAAAGFQFQKVRLKGRLPSFLRVTKRVSIPKGSIKRIRPSIIILVFTSVSIPKGSIKSVARVVGHDVATVFQFQKVRLKAIDLKFKDNILFSFNSKRFD